MKLTQEEKDERARIRAERAKAKATLERRGIIVRIIKGMGTYFYSGGSPVPDEQVEDMHPDISTDIFYE